jgi:hypothetical protein
MTTASTDDDESQPSPAEPADTTADPAQTDHPTGEAQATENAENESPG